MPLKLKVVLSYCTT